MGTEALAQGCRSQPKPSEAHVKEQGQLVIILVRKQAIC